MASALPRTFPAPLGAAGHSPHLPTTPQYVTVHSYVSAQPEVSELMNGTVLVKVLRSRSFSVPLNAARGGTPRGATAGPRYASPYAATLPAPAPHAQAPQTPPLLPDRLPTIPPIPPLQLSTLQPPPPSDSFGSHYPGLYPTADLREASAPSSARSKDTATTGSSYSTSAAPTELGRSFFVPLRQHRRAASTPVTSARHAVQRAPPGPHRASQLAATASLRPLDPNPPAGEFPFVVRSGSTPRRHLVVPLPPSASLDTTATVVLPPPAASPAWGPPAISVQLAPPAASPAWAPPAVSPAWAPPAASLPPPPPGEAVLGTVCADQPYLQAPSSGSASVVGTPLRSPVTLNQTPTFGISLETVAIPVAELAAPRLTRAQSSQTEELMFPLPRIPSHAFSLSPSSAGSPEGSPRDRGGSPRVAPWWPGRDSSATGLPNAWRPTPPPATWVLPATVRLPAAPTPEIVVADLDTDSMPEPVTEPVPSSPAAPTVPSPAPSDPPPPLPSPSPSPSLPPQPSPTPAPAPAPASAPASAPPAPAPAPVLPHRAPAPASASAPAPRRVRLASAPARTTARPMPSSRPLTTAPAAAAPRAGRPPVRAAARAPPTAAPPPPPKPARRPSLVTLVKPLPRHSVPSLRPTNGVRQRSPPRPLGGAATVPANVKPSPRKVPEPFHARSRSQPLARRLQYPDDEVGPRTSSEVLKAPPSQTPRDTSVELLSEDPLESPPDTPASGNGPPLAKASSLNRLLIDPRGAAAAAAGQPTAPNHVPAADPEPAPPPEPSPQPPLDPAERVLRVNHLYEKGKSYFIFGNYQAAANSHREAFQLAKGVSDDLARESLLGMALAHTQLGEHGPALEAYEQAMALLADRDSSDVHALHAVTAQMGAGVAHACLGDRPRAVVCLEEALAVAATRGIPAEAMAACLMLGHLALSAENVDRAIDLYQRAMEMAKKEADPRVQCRARCGLGLASFLQQAYHTALPALSAALLASDLRPPTMWEALTDRRLLAACHRATPALGGEANEAATACVVHLWGVMALLLDDKATFSYPASLPEGFVNSVAEALHAACLPEQHDLAYQYVPFVQRFGLHIFHLLLQRKALQPLLPAETAVDATLACLATRSPEGPEAVDLREAYMAANQLLRALLVCRRAEDDVLELCSCSPYLAPLLGALPRHQRLSGEAALQQASSVVAAIAGLAEPRVTRPATPGPADSALRGNAEEGIPLITAVCDVTNTLLRGDAPPAKAEFPLLCQCLHVLARAPKRFSGAPAVLRTVLDTARLEQCTAGAWPTSSLVMTRAAELQKVVARLQSRDPMNSTQPTTSE